MAHTAFLEVSPSGRIVPVSAYDAEVIEGLPKGVTYKATFTRAQGRSAQHHRLLWGVLQAVADNCSHPMTAENVLDVIKLRTGHCKAVMLEGGVIVQVPASISFSAMDQGRFNAWFDQAVSVIEHDFPCGASVISQFLGQKEAA